MHAGSALRLAALIWGLALVWVVLSQVLLPLGAGVDVLISEPNRTIIYAEIGLSVLSLVIFGVAAIYETGEMFD